MNTSGEVQKGGVAPEECVRLSSHIAVHCPALTLAGLMTIGKYDESAALFFEVRACECVCVRRVCMCVEGGVGGCGWKIVYECVCVCNCVCAVRLVSG